MNSTESLCAFVSTYNRVYCIARLHSNLASHLPKDLNRFTVDDKPTSNTEQLTDSIKEGGPFRIIHTKQENGEKQRDLDPDTARCNSELFIYTNSGNVVISDMTKTTLSRKESTALLHRTKILRKFPFDAEPDKKFTAETSTSCQIGQRCTFALKPYEPIPYFANCHFVECPKVIRSALSPVIAALAWPLAQILHHAIYRKR